MGRGNYITDKVWRAVAQDCYRTETRVECLPGTREDLGSIPSSTESKRKAIRSHLCASAVRWPALANEPQMYQSGPPLKRRTPVRQRQKPQCGTAQNLAGDFEQEGGCIGLSWAPAPLAFFPAGTMAHPEISIHSCGADRVGYTFFLVSMRHHLALLHSSSHLTSGSLSVPCHHPGVPCLLLALMPPGYPGTGLSMAKVAGEGL